MVFLVILNLFFGFWVKNKDFRELVTNEKAYSIHNQFLNEEIAVVLNLNEIENSNNQNLYVDNQYKIILEHVKEEDGQFEIYLRCIGQLNNNNFSLISPFIYDVDQHIMEQGADIEVTYRLDNIDYSRKIQWSSFQILENGIRVSYCLLYGDDEKELVKENKLTQIEFSVRNLIKQRWDKNDKKTV